MTDHPPVVYLRENLLRDEVNSWLGGLFHRDNIDQTVNARAASQTEFEAPSAREGRQERHTDAEARLCRLQDAIEAGVDPAALVESLHEAQAERSAAKSRTGRRAPTSAMTEVEIRETV